MPSRIRYAYSHTPGLTSLGRNHAGRSRHRLVRAERTWLGLAGADAWQPDASATVPDERGDVRGWPQDHAPALDREEGDVGTEDDREAVDRPTQDDGKARDGEAFDDQTRRPQDDAPHVGHFAAIDRQARHQAQLHA